MRPGLKAALERLAANVADRTAAPTPPDIPSFRTKDTDAPIRRPDELELHKQAAENTQIATLAGTTRKMLQPLQEVLSERAYKLLEALHLTALAKLAYTGRSDRAAFVTIFAPQDALMLALNVRSRTTLLKYRNELEAAGYLKCAAQQTTVNGKDYRTGLLWCVKLRPSCQSAPRLHKEDFRAKCRDMAHDLETGHTAYSQKIGHTPMPTKDTLNLKYILHWALTPLYTSKLPSVYVQFAPEVALETVLHVPFAAKSSRREMVNAAAFACCQALGDEHIDFFRWLMVRLLRLRIAGEDYFHGVYGLIQRCITDQHEAFTGNPARLFIGRLKESDLWEKLRRAPATGVY